MPNNIQDRTAITDNLLPRDWMARLALVAAVALLVLFLLAPLAIILKKSIFDAGGQYVGLENFRIYLSKPSALGSIRNSIFIATVSTILTVGLVFLYAYAISRCKVWGASLLRGIAMLPLLTPSLLSAMSLVQLFGNQGILKDFLYGHTIYGPIGIILGMVFAHFPHIYIILSTALSISDNRLYEASECLGASKLRTFLKVTIPGVKFGLLSATIVSFTLSITEFGIPKVIGGQYDVLATDIYKEVVGQQRFEMGAVVSVLLLTPAIIAFLLDRFARRRQVAMLTAQAVPYRPQPNFTRDVVATIYCGVMGAILVGIVLVAIASSFIAFWPYNLSLTLRHYQFERFAGGGWAVYLNSLQMAFWTAIFGTAAVFGGAYLAEKSETKGSLHQIYRTLAILPMAVPGLVLGLSYIFFFNEPNNRLNTIYGTMMILVMSTVIHYYTVCHLTATTVLKQLDTEFESVSDSLKMPRWKIFIRVTLPICMPTILDISVYYFLSAMTTVSAVIFIYSYNTNLASIAVLNMDDAGEYAPAAAMATVIVLTCVGVRILHVLATHRLRRKSQIWRQG